MSAVDEPQELEGPRDAVMVPVVRVFVETVLAEIPELPAERRAGAVELAAHHAELAVAYGVASTMSVRVEVERAKRRALITVTTVGRGELSVPAEDELSW